LRTGTTVSSPRGTIEVSIITGGQEQPLYRRRADHALFTAGAAGTAYRLQVRNLDPYGRIEVITAVDGRNTLKDEPGDTEQNRGLVFGAGATGHFTGWRLSNDETREFVFGAAHQSVAAQATGSAAGTGVIGFAAYSEQPPRPALYTLNAAAEMPSFATGGAVTANVAMAAGAPMAHEASFSSAPSQLGTGIGKRQADHVRSTSFTRYGTPDIIIIRYDTLAALRAMGITGDEPPAFPGVPAGYDRYTAA
jgi:hypothetical protein